MRKRPKKQLSYDDWPQEDRRRWDVAFRGGDFLEGAGPKTHLAASTRSALRSVYGRFLGFMADAHPGRLFRRPAERIDQEVIVSYVKYLKLSCQDRTITNELRHLVLALATVCPEFDWSWLRAIANRIAVQAKPRHYRHHLITSEKLYALGISLMDLAVDASKTAGGISKTHAFDYRDGLMIAALAAFPLRRRTFAALHINKHLSKSGNAWLLDVGADDTKSRRPIEFEISPALSDRIDIYLNEFRKRIPGANAHDGLWASNKGRAMDDGTIYDMVRRRSRAAFGFPVNLHRFRHAAATFWSIRDPKNVRGTKDLLGHVSFGITVKHYNMARSRVAGRVLAQILRR